MTREMAPQFACTLAVVRLFPAAEWFGRSYGQANVGAKGVQQPVGFETRHVATVPLLRIMIRAAGQEANLRHGKRFHLARYVLPRELDRAIEWRRVRGQRPPEIAGSGTG